MSEANGAAGAFAPSFGDKARSIVCRNVSAVTVSGTEFEGCRNAAGLSLEGGEKRNPGRMRNLYVRPSRETVGIATAISGRRRVPSGPPESG
jgi:hypothetical protein